MDKRSLDKKCLAVVIAVLAAGCAPSKPDRTAAYDSCSDMRKTSVEITRLEQENQDYQAQVSILESQGGNDSADAEKARGYRIRMESNEEKKLGLMRYNQKNTEACDDQLRQDGRYRSLEREPDREPGSR